MTIKITVAINEKGFWGYDVEASDGTRCLYPLAEYATPHEAARAAMEALTTLTTYVLTHLRDGPSREPPNPAKG